MKNTFWTTVPSVVVCAPGGGFVLALEYAKGAIFARELGLILILLVVCLFLTIVATQRGHWNQAGLSPETVPTASKARALRNVRAAVVILPILLIFGLWFTRGGPLFPRLVGAGINLTITWGLVTFLRREENSRK